MKIFNNEVIVITTSTQPSYLTNSFTLSVVMNLSLRQSQKEQSSKDHVY